VKWLDSIPLWALVVGTVFLGLAPFTPEPHLFEKIRMLANGALSRPIDIFDLFLHGTLPVLLIIRLVRVARTARQ
jgi:hypothetical protein